MSYRFKIVAGSMDVFESFLRSKPSRVGISHDSVRKPERKPTMAYDSAEDILQFIATVAYDIDISLFSAWLYEVVSKSSRRKTTVNGLPIPESKAELAALIAKLISEQKGGAEDASPIDKS
jgi:hypothetical protein